MNIDPNTDQVTCEIIDLFVATIGFIPRETVHANSNFIRDFQIIDDDLTCFMMQVKKQYHLNPAPSDWAYIETISGVVDLVLAKR